MGLAGPLTASRTTARGKASVVHRRKYSHGRYCRTKHPCRYRTSMLALPFVTKIINLRHCLVYRISIRPSSSQFVGALLVRLVPIRCLNEIQWRRQISYTVLVPISVAGFFVVAYFRGSYKHFCGRSPNPTCPCITHIHVVFRILAADAELPCPGRWS